jgi:hypothetical protein
MKRVLRYNVGCLLFRQFMSGHVVHKRIYSVKFFFETLIFLVMLRNVTTLRYSDCSGRKVFISTLPCDS